VSQASLVGGTRSRDGRGAPCSRILVAEGPAREGGPASWIHVANAGALCCGVIHGGAKPAGGCTFQSQHKRPTSRITWSTCSQEPWDAARPPASPVGSPEKMYLEIGGGSLRIYLYLLIRSSAFVTHVEPCLMPDGTLLKLIGKTSFYLRAGPCRLARQNASNRILRTRQLQLCPAL
jgi:hypothetical protein